MDDFIVVLVNRASYERWESRVSFATATAMRGWLQSLEATGPPATIGVTAGGTQLAAGPNDESVEFTVLPKPLQLGLGPPYALIAILNVE